MTDDQTGQLVGVTRQALRSASTASAGAWSPDRATWSSGVVISAGTPADLAGGDPRDLLLNLGRRGLAHLRGRPRRRVTRGSGRRVLHLTAASDETSDEEDGDGQTVHARTRLRQCLMRQ